MDVLIVGAGVIGTVYGAHLGAAGHAVSVLSHPPRTGEMERALRQRGFAVQAVTDMDGWLAYHAAFVACMAAALYRCGTDAAWLAANRRPSPSCAQP